MTKGGVAERTQVAITTGVAQTRSLEGSLRHRKTCKAISATISGLAFVLVEITQRCETRGEAPLVPNGAPQMRRRTYDFEGAQ